LRGGGLLGARDPGVCCRLDLRVWGDDGSAWMS